ncbi:hypothetical protein [Azospirillum agricola]|uniref:hypothetical protein n=1 Tax=Azospirillum agricola TaxID=1720247 RepID=UPI000A0F261B|nr:hypothetical protein [Azospirillum agricola]SMH29794.1 hypothetical protein SAMN02982994_0228 [Azospirillum lipoferum]
MLYALVTADGAIARNEAGFDRYQDFVDEPPDLAPAKGLRWLPVADTRPDPGPGERLSGPAVTVSEDAVTRVWSVEPAPPPPVPASVSAFQARAVLHRSGLLPAVEAAMTASDDAEARLAWEYAVEFVRAGPLLTAVAAQLGLTDEQIDDLFREAATIQA